MCFSRKNVTQIGKNIFPVLQKQNLRNPRIGLKAAKNLNSPVLPCR